MKSSKFLFLVAALISFSMTVSVSTHAGEKKLEKKLQKSDREFIKELTQDLDNAISPGQLIEAKNKVQRMLVNQDDSSTQVLLDFAKKLEQRASQENSSVKQIQVMLINDLGRVIDKDDIDNLRNTLADSGVGIRTRAIALHSLILMGHRGFDVSIDTVRNQLNIIFPSLMEARNVLVLDTLMSKSYFMPELAAALGENSVNLSSFADSFLSQNRLPKVSMNLVVEACQKAANAQVVAVCRDEIAQDLARMSLAQYLSSGVREDAKEYLRQLGYQVNDSYARSREVSAGRVQAPKDMGIWVIHVSPDSSSGTYAGERPNLRPGTNVSVRPAN